MATSSETTRGTRTTRRATQPRALSREEKGTLGMLSAYHLRHRGRARGRDRPATTVGEQPDRQQASPHCFLQWPVIARTPHPVSPYIDRRLKSSLEVAEFRDR